MIGTDYHIHTHHCHCANASMTIPAIISRCRELERTSIAITGHRDNEEAARNNQLVRLELEQADTQGLEVFFGCEVSIKNHKGELPITEAQAKSEGFEVIIAGAHGSMYYEHEATLEKVINLHMKISTIVAANPIVDVVVHPWCFGEFNSWPWFKEQFKTLEIVPDELTCRFAKTCVENDTAVELNVLSSILWDALTDEFKESYKRFIVRLLELGCSISLGTDAHHIPDLESIYEGEKVMEELKIPESRIWRPRVVPKVAGSRFTGKSTNGGVHCASDQINRDEG